MGTLEPTKTKTDIHLITSDKSWLDRFDVAHGDYDTGLGTVKWDNKSPNRAKHKRANWFIGVEMVYQVDKSSADINEKDVTFETFGASGPGGQHTNKTDSVVRAKHAASGQQVVVKSAHSQHANKKLALLLLADQIKKQNQHAENGAMKNRWKIHKQLERGKPVKVFSGQEFSEKAN